MANPEKPFASVAKVHQEELERLEVMWHRELAVAAALDYCEQYGLSAPPWLIKDAAAVLCSRLRREKSEKRGRSAGAVARYRQDMIDLDRHSAVQEVRSKQKEFKLRVQELRALRKVPTAMMKESEKMQNWLRRTWLHVYECAAMILAGTKASAKPETIKSSYQKVERSADSEQPFRYMILNARFLRRVGIESDIGRPRGKQRVPFYDLIL